MLVSLQALIVLITLLILLTLLFPQSKKQETSKNLLNYSQEKNNVYTYLDHKIFIQNPEMLKFIDSILYYIDVSPPIFLRFLDELNRFYRNIWMINKSISSSNIRTCDNTGMVQSINMQMTKIIYEYHILVTLFDEFRIVMPSDLLPRFDAQRVVFDTIIKEQVEYVCDKVNHYNFANKCLTRYSVHDLEHTSAKNDKLEQGELSYIPL